MLTPPPNDYAGQLAAQADGAHDDATTIGVAQVIAEAVRLLSYATRRGGVTEPATIHTAAGELASAAYRLPQVLGQLHKWLTTEIRAGRVADDHGRRAWELEDDLRIAIAEASEHAERLAGALAAVQSLASTMHSANRGDEQ